MRKPPPGPEAPSLRRRIWEAIWVSALYIGLAVAGLAILAWWILRENHT